jgi:hypothetical protein
MYKRLAYETDSFAPDDDYQDTGRQQHDIRDEFKVVLESVHNDTAHGKCGE